MHTLSAFQTQTWSSEMGDYIGMESCVDLQHNEEVVDDSGCNEDEYSRLRLCGKRERRWEAARRREKEYPPPIPLLAQTQNMPSRIPWVLKRYYTGDGRLIIREEKASHQEYFRAHRSNGRLTLQLVAFHDEVLPLSPVVGYDEEEREDNNVESNLDQDDDADQCEVGAVDVGDEIVRDRTVEEGVTVRLLAEPTAVESETVVMGGGGGGGGKCYNYSYSSVRSNPCMFGMPVPAIKPVHI